MPCPVHEKSRVGVCADLPTAVWAGTQDFSFSLKHLPHIVVSSSGPAWFFGILISMLLTTKRPRAYSWW